MFGLKAMRRKRLREKPLPREWVEIIRRNLPYYRQLPEGDRQELHGHIQVLLAEKHFEGCGGLELTDEIRVTVAAHACILLLHRRANYYPKLTSILVYPQAYVARKVEKDPNGLVSELDETRSGESWDRGMLVLSWEDVRRQAADPRSGHNVVLHEFAHQLDQEDGKVDGAPGLPGKSRSQTWAQVLRREYERLIRAVEQNRRGVIDAYGAESPAEFFAVVTECFFTKPGPLRDRHPELYEQFRLFYRQDPAELGPGEEPPGNEYRSGRDS